MRGFQKSSCIEGADMLYDGSEPKTLHEKRVSPGGRVRYIPTGTMWPTNYFQPGTYIVRVDKNIKSVARIVEPARAEVAAAIEEARDTMQKKLSELLRFLPKEHFNTDIEQEAYEQYAQTFIDKGLDPYPMTLSMQSVWDIVDAAINALKDHE